VKIELHNRGGIIRLVCEDYEVILPDGEGLVIQVDNEKLILKLLEDK